MVRLKKIIIFIKKQILKFTNANEDKLVPTEKKKDNNLKIGRGINKLIL